VEYHAGGLFPRLEFILTNLETLSRAVVRFYNKRGTAEQWIKGGEAGRKDDPPLLSWFSLEPGAAGAGLLTYNLGNLWRRLG